MAERDITITLKAKNLTQGQFDAARDELKKLGIEADGMTSRGKRLGDQFTQTGSAAGVFNTQMGIVFWLLSASVYGAQRTAIAEESLALEQESLALELDAESEHVHTEHSI